MDSKLDTILDGLLVKNGYIGRKRRFRDNFKQVCHHVAIADLIKRLPNGEKAKIEEKIDKDHLPGGVKRLLEDVLGPGEYEKALFKAAQKVFDQVFA